MTQENRRAVFQKDLALTFEQRATAIDLLQVKLGKKVTVESNNDTVDLALRAVLADEVLNYDELLVALENDNKNYEYHDLFFNEHIAGLVKLNTNIEAIISLLHESREVTDASRDVRFDSFITKVVAPVLTIGVIQAAENLESKEITLFFLVVYYLLLFIQTTNESEKLSTASARIKEQIIKVFTGDESK